MCPAVEPALNGQYFSILFASVCLLRASLMNAGRFWGRRINPKGKETWGNSLEASLLSFISDLSRNYFCFKGGL